MTTLPKVIDDDSQAITAELIAAYEAMTGKTLYPAQVERLLIDLVAYRETLLRSAMNDAARQNLVAFARAPMLDYLGELVGVYRLAAQSARTIVRITFAAPLATVLLIPAGIRLQTASGVQFQLQAEKLVPAGSLFADVSVMALEAGIAGNGYLAGQVNQLIDGIGVTVASVANLSVTSAGAEDEQDDRLRESIKLAPESFSVAGSRLAYRQHAMRAHQDIVEVAVLSSTPGTIQLYPLVKTGLPTAAILSAVSAQCSHEKVRPLSDTVQVLTPTERSYSLSARLTLYSNADATSVLANAQQQANLFVATQSAALGRDIVPTQIVSVLSVPGVYQVALLAPVALLTVGDAEWAHCISVDIQLAGVSDG
ncbi:baseplate assembly protein [Iodobacter sp. BJB302]|uniref:baseplate assembly protein n=1 Tax=Iodobacter sp. BJB302 TaxID=1506510 RepID=UPI000C0E4725|nr:baseplate J/gp47 family protein [Iodobacter sp. BJB302]PHV00156.1 baseplate protein [Iodobacter sp. BJB302]